jgi:hypothetical protein
VKPIEHIWKTVALAGVYFEYQPDCFYAIELPRGFRSVSKPTVTDLGPEIAAALEPLIGGVLDNITEIQIQQSIEYVLRKYREVDAILVWADEERANPVLIDTIVMRNEGGGRLRVRPYFDPAEIMDEALAKAGIP